MGGSARDDGGGAFQERDTAESAILRSRKWQKSHAEENDEICLTVAEMVTRVRWACVVWWTFVWSLCVELRARVEGREEREEEERTRSAQLARDDRKLNTRAAGP